MTYSTTVTQKGQMAVRSVVDNPVIALLTFDKKLARKMPNLASELA